MDVGEVDGIKAMLEKIENPLYGLFSRLEGRGLCVACRSMDSWMEGMWIAACRAGKVADRKTSGGDRTIEIWRGSEKRSIDGLQPTSDRYLSDTLSSSVHPSS